MSDENSLSNARIIEWEVQDMDVMVPHAAIRPNRHESFYEGDQGITEAKARELGARVVAFFPERTLAEIVGDAPAFLYEHDDSRCVAYRLWAWRGPGDDGLWHARTFGTDEDSRDFLLERSLHAFPEIDLASVVPLAPAREVAS